MWIPQSTAVIISLLSFCCLFVEPSPTSKKRHPDDNCQGDVTAPPLSSVQITNISYFGDGCTADSGSVRVFFDEALGTDYIRLNYTGFTARTGSAIPSRLNIISCNVIFTLEHPANWNFTLTRGTVNGNVTLSSTIPMSASISREYQLDDGPQEVKASEESGSSWERPFAITDSLELAGAEDPSVCLTENSRGVFKLRNTVGLPFSRDSYGEIDFLDQLLQLTWEECTGEP